MCLSRPRLGSTVFYFTMGKEKIVDREGTFSPVLCSHLPGDTHTTPLRESTCDPPGGAQTQTPLTKYAQRDSRKHP